MSETITRTRPAAARPVIQQPDMGMGSDERRALAKATGKEAGGVNVQRFFEAHKESLAKLLPQHMTPERFMRVTLNSLRTTPKLMECTLESLFGATVFCAQIGLEPNTPMGHIYLIPFKNNRKNRTEVQVIIGYKGYIELARRSGQIVSISAQPVYEKDAFDFDYLRMGDLSHKPFMGGDRGKIIGAWAHAELAGGGSAFDFMPLADIERIRDGSQGYRTAKRFNSSDSPWIAHFDQMARKTAVRRLAKMLPMSVEMAAATALDERDDRRASQGLHGMMQEALEGAAFDLSAVTTEGDAEDEAADEDPRPQVEAPARPAAEPEAPAEPQARRRTPPKVEPEAPPADDGDPGPDAPPPSGDGFNFGA
jgi:recombination protein RecT